MTQALVAAIFSLAGLGTASPPVEVQKPAPKEGNAGQGIEAPEEVMPSAPTNDAAQPDVSETGFPVNGEAQSSPNDVADKSPGDPDTRQGSEATSKQEIKRLIRQVFGPVGDKAVAVARCESTFRTNARSGQHRGLFQMGSAERSRFGHGPDALTQIQAAKRYFDISGWRPWRACA